MGHQEGCSREADIWDLMFHGSEPPPPQHPLPPTAWPALWGPITGTQFFFPQLGLWFAESLMPVLGGGVVTAVRTRNTPLLPSPKKHGGWPALEYYFDGGDIWIKISPPCTYTYTISGMYIYYIRNIYIRNVYIYYDKTIGSLDSLDPKAPHFPPFI